MKRVFSPISPTSLHLQPKQKVMCRSLFLKQKIWNYQYHHQLQVIIICFLVFYSPIHEKTFKAGASKSRFVYLWYTHKKMRQVQRQTTMTCGILHISNVGTLSDDHSSDNPSRLLCQGISQVREEATDESLDTFPWKHWAVVLRKCLTVTVGSKASQQCMYILQTLLLCGWLSLQVAG